MTIITKITVSCSGATNGKPCPETFVQEGENVTKRSTKLAARKAGWYWRRKAVQLCAAHRPSANKANGSKKATTAAKKAPVATKKASKKVTVTTTARKGGRAALPLVAKGSSPIKGAQSTGRLARSAKAKN